MRRRHAAKIQIEIVQLRWRDTCIVKLNMRLTTVMDLVLEESCLATMYRIFRQTDDLTTAVTHPLTMIETDAMGFLHHDRGADHRRACGTP